MPLHRRQCNDCGHDFEMLSWRGHLAALDHPMFDKLSSGQAEEAWLAGELNECPECCSPNLRSLVSVGRGILLGGEAGVGREYPYFDRSLGMQIHSRQHHREVCRRLGLRQADDGMDAELENHRRRQAERAKHEAVYNEMVKQQQSDPDVRRTQDLIQRAVDDGVPSHRAIHELARRM